MGWEQGDLIIIYHSGLSSIRHVVKPSPGKVKV